MTDLISRQEAIEWVLNWIDVNKYYHPYSKCEYMPVNEVIDRLKQVPTIEAEPKWIPCSERLPNVRQWVLCQCRAGIMDVLRLTADGSWNKNYPHTEYMTSFVLAWMPLPKAYSEVEE